MFENEVQKFISLTLLTVELMLRALSKAPNLHYTKTHTLKLLYKHAEDSPKEVGVSQKLSEERMHQCVCVWLHSNQEYELHTFSECFVYLLSMRKNVIPRLNGGSSPLPWLAIAQF